MTDDPLQTLRDARDAARRGAHAEALEKYLWFHHHALEHRPSLTGVRLSYAISEWVQPPGVTNYTYDANGFQTSVQQPGLPANSITYNLFGGVGIAIDAAHANGVVTVYDANFNPVVVQDTLNGAGTPVSSSTYDALGNLLTLTDANNKTTQYAYDPKGNLIQVTDALSQVTHYTYDAMDRLISQTDPINNTTTFTYDALGKLKTKTDALNKTTTYVYDNDGNKTSETDANNHTTSYQYDYMNRVTKITYPDTTFKTFTYDFRGNKLTEVDQSRS